MIEPLRLLVVSASPLTRAGLAGALGEAFASAQINCVGSLAATAQPWRELWGQMDAVVAELATAGQLADWGQAWAQSAAQAAAPSANSSPHQVLLLADPGLLHGQPDWMRAWQSGQLSLLAHDVDPHAVAAAVLAACNGLASISPRWAGELSRALTVPTSLDFEVGHLAAEPALPSWMEPLTGREQEVFGLLAQGLNNQDIGVQLGISRHTAKFHVSQILTKLGAASRTEAVTLGLRLGLVGV